MQHQNTLTIMVHSQNFDISIHDDFTIWLSVQMHQDFKDYNISRQQLLTAYVKRVYELYKMDNEIGTIIESFPQT